MSARWTLGCRQDRLRRVVAAKPGTLTSGTSLTFSCQASSDSCPVGPGGVGETPALAAYVVGWPTPRGWGSTVQGLCVLHEGPTHLEYPRPSSSSAPPSCSTGQALSRRPRVVAPAPAGEASNENQAGFAHRTGVLGRQGAPRSGRRSCSCSSRRCLEMSRSSCV